MKIKWYQSPLFIAILCLLVFPVGLMLLGSDRHVRWFSKLLVSIAYMVIILVFFVYYEPVPRKNTVSNISASTETVEYKINRFYLKGETLNGLSETVKPLEDEIFLFVDLEVMNAGDKKLFFISLVDDPKVMTESGVFYPDLTLSREPFGEIEPKQTQSGFLVFRIPAGEKLNEFRISDLRSDIDF